MDGLKKEGGRLEGTENLTYQDNCYLGRLFGIYEEPREVIKILGGKIIEFEKNKEEAICSGACGGVYENFPEWTPFSGMVNGFRFEGGSQFLMKNFIHTKLDNDTI